MASPTLQCVSSAIPTPYCSGTQVLDISAHLVQDFTLTSPDTLNYNHETLTATNIDYCNITVSYTHPGKGDKINVESWMPMTGWNSRLQAVGGAGYTAGRDGLSTFEMAGALAEGYATTTTDAGLPLFAFLPDSWALNSLGKPNIVALTDLASLSLYEQAVFGKALVKSFYGKPPVYSYFSGCSQGGRQGYELAYKYPDAYDGIAASAPGLDMSRFTPQSAWSQVLMSIWKDWPAPCELEAITAAAVNACDALDGIVDGLVADVDACHFDPFPLVGKTINCTDIPGKTQIPISLTAAKVANATWTGPRTSTGGFLYYGLESQAQLTGVDEGGQILSLADTNCTSGTCVALPAGDGESWFRFFVKADPAWNYTLIRSVDEYTQLFQASVRMYDYLFGPDPNLKPFHAAGGKLMTYHGLADTFIPSRRTRKYYDQVTALTPNVHDFYRYYEVPGLGHCSGGNGGQPTTVFHDLVKWVENGIAPGPLPVNVTTSAGVLNQRILCAYPERAVLKSKNADPAKRESFKCVGPAK